MGSFFAGIKAGTLGGIIYVGGLAAFNVILLYALKADALRAIYQANPSSCPLVPSVNASAQECFNLVVSVSVPFAAFVTFLLAFVLSGLFGMYYDSFPTKSASAKGFGFSVVMILSIILGAPIIFGIGLVYAFDFQSQVAAVVFLLIWTPAFGYSMGRLYRRYTREVGFESEAPSMLRVLADGRDVTGKSRTFAITSSHRLRAEVSEGASFRDWEVSGAITLEDPRSFETLMEVGGEGALLGRVVSKY